ncbi:MAG: phage tail protein [Dokdonella sp.]|uniref:phage tail protein n=1 Tax=Dokdonella sp. TaxID=2291710 RepID=UPI003F7F1D0F
MSQPFLGEIRMFGCNFAPHRWAMCNGQVMSIAQNTALFSLLGTFYGGNGQTTFALPDLQSRSPMHQGQGPGLTPRSLGENGGSETVALTVQQLPAHNHALGAQGARADRANATGSLLAQGAQSIYAGGSSPTTTLAPQSTGSAGSSLPHYNMQPYAVVNFCIALEGIYPARN